MMAGSTFRNIDNAPPIEVFQLTKLFNECQSSVKVNLGIGAYRDEDGKPWILPIVRTVELQMANDLTLNHEYLPIAGLPNFRTSAAQLMLGYNHKVILENKVEAFQAPGGTGALRLAAGFLRNVLKSNTVYLSSPTWGEFPSQTTENHKGIFRSAGFSSIIEYSYWNSATKSLDFANMCEDLMNAPPNAIVILHAIAHNPTGVDPTTEQWQDICAICKDKHLLVLMDCAYQGFASGNLDSDAWAPRYFADQDMDMLIAQSFSKNFGLYNERVGNLIVVSKDGNKLSDIRSQMEVYIRTLWSNPPNHGARVVATILNNKSYLDDWKLQLFTMANRIEKMRHLLVDNLKKLGTPGNWDFITNQIGMFSFTGLTEKQVRYMKSKYIFLLSSGRISMSGITLNNVAYVAKTIDEAIRAHPILQLSETAGEPAIGSKRYCLEFAKQKLSQVEYNVIKTGVVIDGVLVKEDQNIEQEDDESVHSFVKVNLVGSLSSSSSLDFKMSEQVKGSVESLQQVQVEIVEDSPHEDEHGIHEVLSNSTQPGTWRTSVKTFKTQSIQTLKDCEVNDMYQLKSIPTRFEGTMLTPVYFDGLMLTSERLDNLLTDVTKKGENSIPVKFQGGMLTAAFKTLAENLDLGSGFEPVNVKFQGRLKGLTNNETSGGIPVAFEGNMIPQQKNAKGKG